MELLRSPSLVICLWLSVIVGTGAEDCAEETLNGVCNCGYRSIWKGYQCNECKDHDFWGNGCDLACPKDLCPYGCDYIGRCLNPFIKNCAHSPRIGDKATVATMVVNDRGECQACKKGYYGVMCDKHCDGGSDKHCEEGPEGFCTRAGLCFSCQEGWFGENCTQECPAGCPRCVMKDGLVKAGEDDEDFIPAGHCAEPCEGNFWGMACHQPCPASCKQHMWKSSCVKDNGECIACQGGQKWWGPHCDRPCPKGCRGGRCDHRTGQCIEGECEDGYWGEDCSHVCSENCESNSCFRKHGECKGSCLGSILTNTDCLGACKPGWWMNDCTHPCPQFTDGSCQQNDGLPLKCEDGYYPGYSDNRTDGVDVGVYTNVYKGHDGKIIVRETHDYVNSNSLGFLSAGAKVEVTKTEMYNGITRLYYTHIVSGTGPESGWLTHQLSSGLNLMILDPIAECKTCPSECIGGVCDQSGSCTKGCIPGFYGRQCDQICSSNCDGQGCDLIYAGAAKDGWCKKCLDGWTGGKCLDRCHASCAACTQHDSLMGVLLWGPADEDKHCTKCDPNEPAALPPGKTDGKCECIRHASRNATTDKCYCNDPDEDSKEPHFESTPWKVCRAICKKTGPIKYVEVFGHQKSDCLTKAKERVVQHALWDNKPCDSGSECAANECKYTCDENVCTDGKGYFCLLKEYVDYLDR